MVRDDLDKKTLAGLLDMLGKVEDKEAKIHGWDLKLYSTNEIIDNINRRTELGLKYYKMYVRHMGLKDGSVSWPN